MTILVELRIDQYGNGVQFRVFLKGHFVKTKMLHPSTLLGGTKKEHIQKERLIKQV